jgi:dinuclear metal center YbgI/SA1388 family protein
MTPPPPSPAEAAPEQVFGFLDDLLELPGTPDYPGAWNGVQVECQGPVRRVAAAVDASMATIQGAVAKGADLLLVHHGLFWNPDPRLVGPAYRRVRRLLESGMGLYSAHLPLDAHPEIGNAAVLARSVGVEVEGHFGEAKGVSIGWWGTLEEDRDAFVARVASAVQGPVQLIPGGPQRVARVGVVTGAGGSFIRDAAAAGLDTLLTGEGAHHTFTEAMEHGINVLYAGHYATETWGVRALAQRLESAFGLPWDFIHVPSGL